MKRFRLDAAGVPVLLITEFHVIEVAGGQASQAGDDTGPNPQRQCFRECIGCAAVGGFEDGD
jgi:hypothetical protein